MSFFRADGILLHYQVSGPGEAPPLVLINSLGTDSRIWADVAGQFARTFRVVSYDKRGHGLSDTPEGDYTLEHHVADLSSLLDHLDIDRAAVAGVSVGGLIAQGFALDHPDRTACAILCNTAPKIGDAATWDERMAVVRSKGLEPIVEAVLERWFSADFRRNRPDDLAGWRNLFLSTDPLGYVATCATLRNTDLSGRIGTLQIPTLVVSGEFDQATPARLVRACAEAIPGSRYTMLHGVGHIPSIEQPRALAALIKNFLKEANYG